MAARSLTSPPLTVPNLITLTRILLTPLFVIFLIQGWYHRALLIFLLAGISDLADGLIARTWKQKTKLGSYLDPLADKLLMASSFVTLSIYYAIPSWVTVVVLSRDIVLGLGVLIFRLADYPLVIRPTLAGKWTTTFQIATVFLVLVGKIWPLRPMVLLAFFCATAALTIISGLQYVYGGLKTMNLLAGSNHHGGSGG